MVQKSSASNAENEMQSLHIPQLYTPSWVDRFTDWVDRLPGPSWIYYLGIAISLIFIQTTVAWVESALPIGTFLPIHAFLAIVITFFLWLFYYLDERAGSALKTLRPVLLASDDEYQEMHYQLTTLPARQTLLAGFTILGLSILTELIREPYTLDALMGFPISATLFRFTYMLCWWVLGAFFYHTIHQLRLIHHIYTRHTRVNLFRMRPLYAFSNLSAITAGSMTMIIYGWLIVAPDMPLNDPGVLAWVIIFLVIAVVTFAWPQLGMHQLQVAEQERLLDNAYLRLEAAISELHQQLDQKVFDDMESLNYAIASLEIEINTLKRIRTWPWEPETLQLLVTALAFPLGIWLIQFIFELIFS
jgi:hypothetical protein